MGSFQVIIAWLLLTIRRLLDATSLDARGAWRSEFATAAGERMASGRAAFPRGNVRDLRLTFCGDHPWRFRFRVDSWPWRDRGGLILRRNSSRHFTHGTSSAPSLSVPRVAVG